jgi:lipoyl(octanoyl) transferase
MTGRRIAPPVEWRIDDAPVDYQAASDAMEARVAAIRAGEAPELVWLLEHPHVYTAGVSARPQDLLDPGDAPVIATRRGGQYTYHGPGQRVAYAMLNLDRHGRDVRRYVWMLEQWTIDTLERLGVRGERRRGRVGVWVTRPEKAPGPDGALCEEKIAAIGVRVRRWVSFHGLAINVEPDLSRFDGIVPCGIAEHGVTSLHDLGITATTDDVDIALRAAFRDIFERD